MRILRRQNMQPFIFMNTPTSTYQKKTGVLWWYSPSFPFFFLSFSFFFTNTNTLPLPAKGHSCNFSRWHKHTHTHRHTHTGTKMWRKCRSSMGEWKLEAVFFLAVDTHQFQGNCSPHYWKVLPECQLRGKFLTSHHTNKQCAPLPLIKGGVSADRESGRGQRGGKEEMKGAREAQRKGDEETGDFFLVLSKKCFWPRFCAGGP